MDTTTGSTRVTREEAAELAGVATRTINRWAARGLLSVTYEPGRYGRALYDRAEVQTQAEVWRAALASFGTSLPAG